MITYVRVDVLLYRRPSSHPSVQTDVSRRDIQTATPTLSGSLSLIRQCQPRDASCTFATTLGKFERSADNKSRLINVPPLSSSEENVHVFRARYLFIIFINRSFGAASTLSSFIYRRIDCCFTQDRGYGIVVQVARK